MKLLRRFKYTHKGLVVRVRAKNRVDADITFYRLMRQLNNPNFKWENVKVKELELESE